MRKNSQKIVAGVANPQKDIGQRGAIDKGEQGLPAGPMQDQRLGNRGLALACKQLKTHRKVAARQARKANLQRIALSGRVIQNDIPRLCQTLDHKGISAAPAGQPVKTAAASQPIIAIAAIQAVIPGAAVDPIRPAVAEQPVRPGPGEDDIVAIPPKTVSLPAPPRSVSGPSPPPTGSRPRFQ